MRRGLPLCAEQNKTELLCGCWRPSEPGWAHTGLREGGVEMAGGRQEAPAFLHTDTVQELDLPILALDDERGSHVIRKPVGGMADQ